MVKHIVMFHFKGTGEEKNQNIKHFKDMLDALKNKIPELRSLETGINFSASPAAYDLVLVTEFDSAEDLEKYKKHPDHQSILPTLRELTDEVHVVDYNS